MTVAIWDLPELVVYRLAVLSRIVGLRIVPGPIKKSPKKKWLVDFVNKNCFYLRLI